MPREKQIQTERESNQSCCTVFVLKRCACGCHPENSDGDEKKHRAHQLLSGKKFPAALVSCSRPLTGIRDPSICSHTETSCFLIFLTLRLHGLVTVYQKLDKPHYGDRVGSPPHLTPPISLLPTAYQHRSNKTQIVA